LRELKALKKLKHPNIVKLSELVRDQSLLYFVFEFCDSNLHQMVVERSRGRGFQHSEIRSLMSQLFSGLAFIHRTGFFHRDIKPENLLLKSGSLKIADLGCCREIRSRPPFTEYVATRWYRSPEILLQTSSYNSPVDLWACGCILAELYRCQTLFPGSSSIDTLNKIVAVLGTPSVEQWPDVVQVAGGFKFPKCTAQPWAKVMPNAPAPAFQLIAACMRYDPYRRPTAVQALQFPFFVDILNSSSDETINGAMKDMKLVPDSKDGYSSYEQSQTPLSPTLDLDIASPRCNGLAQAKDGPPNGQDGKNTIDLEDTMSLETLEVLLSKAQGRAESKSALDSSFAEGSLNDDDITSLLRDVDRGMSSVADVK